MSVKNNERIRVVIFVRYKTEDFDKFVKACKDYPDVTDCYRLTGEYDGIIMVEAKDLNELYEFMRYLGKFEGLQKMDTHIVMQEWLK